MKLALRPVAFLLGFTVGLLSLAWLGATLESPHLKSDFVHVHQRIDIESGYYMTARQMITIVRSRLSSDTKVYVIVGGSSTLNGVGQQESEIWTRHLQDMLGPQFRVINFAFRAGSMFDSGNVAAEWLLSQSLPVIYIGSGFEIDPLSQRHGYLLLDAWHRGYLLPWPPRDRALRSAAFSTSDRVRSAALGAALNSYLFFNDFWSYFTYEFATLNWNFLLQPEWYRPRYRTGDSEGPRRAGSSYPADFDGEMRKLRAQAAADPQIKRARVGSYVDVAIPARLRMVTLAIVDMWSPYYRNRLDSAMQASLIQQARDMACTLEELGLHRGLAIAADFTADDYVDAVHFSVSGGVKLARSLAPEVTALARKLGYLP